MEFVVFERPLATVGLFEAKLVVERIERNSGGWGSIVVNEDVRFNFEFDPFFPVEALLSARDSPDDACTCE